MAPQLSHIHLPQTRLSEFENLGGWDFDGVGKTFGNKVPGYRSTSSILLPLRPLQPSTNSTPGGHCDSASAFSIVRAEYPSTAFLTTLRSNLHLSTSLPSPAISTPTTPAFSSAAVQYPAPSPLSITTTTSSPPALFPAAMTAIAPTSKQEPPELTYNVAPTDPVDDRVEALKLIADSVAQQRQAASKAVILNPATVSATVLVLAIMAKYIELSLMLTTSVGLIMTALLAVRWYTSGYLAKAEAINRAWLENPRTADQNNGNGNGSSPKKNGSKNDDPIVLISKWGDEIIGALVVRIVKRERKGYVRAWTVKLRYRNKGIGRGLLEEAAKIVWGRGGRMMDFASQHANSHRVLPPFFNGPFERNEAHARDMLADVVAEVKRERSSR
ncbi:MAG: hypothetical protein Q9217_006849 [Psora testacea]